MRTTMPHWYELVQIESIDIVAAGDGDEMFVIVRSDGPLGERDLSEALAAYLPVGEYEELRDGYDLDRPAFFVPDLQVEGDVDGFQHGWAIVPRREFSESPVRVIAVAGR